MGRWAQRTVRGGGGGVEAAAAILSVSQIGVDTASVLFNRSVVAVDGPTSDSGLTIDGNDVEDVTTLDATRVQVTVAGAAAGLPWALGAQPIWLTTPVAFPAAGVVLA